MNIGAALVTNTQATELMQPGNSVFHHPAGNAQATAVRGTSARNLGTDAAGSERVP